MRAPFQEGDFPGPVKYGYLNVGVVEQGSPQGRTVFCLYPHQTRVRRPGVGRDAVPDAVPPGRAVLAGTVETAVNAVWDAAPQVGDRITVVGAGMVGCCVAALLTRIPGTKVQLVDADPAKADVAGRARRRLRGTGERRGRPRPRRPRQRHRGGPARSLDLLAPDGTVVELSWYGDRRGLPAPRRVLPLPPPHHPQQPGRRRLRPPSARTVRSPTGSARPRPARRPGVRRADHRRVRVRGTARQSCQARRR